MSLINIFYKLVIQGFNLGNEFFTVLSVSIFQLNQLRLYLLSVDLHIVE
jgi:hypothetical protein